MTFEEKQKAFEEQQFKKRWGNFLKKCPNIESVSRDVGKAPACNTKVKQPKADIGAQKPKKK